MPEHYDKEQSRPYKHYKLLELFKESSDADEKTYREMRSSIKMHAGDHYGRQGNNSRGWGSITRTGNNTKKDLNRVRLVKNHAPRVADTYVNQIMDTVPDVEVISINSNDARSQRIADLNNQVLSEDKRRTKKYKQRLREKALDFVVTGEIAVKLFWDEDKDWVAEQDILPFDLLRAPGIKKVEDSPWLIHRNIFSLDELKTMFGEEWVKKNAGSQSSPMDQGVEAYGQAHVVFDTQEREYQRMEGMEIREFYLRPTAKFPNGYFCYFTDSGIIQEGELPGGIFPIQVARCLTTTSMSRGHSPFKKMYPYQQEINRASSQDASNNIHFGDDKMITGAHANVNIGDQIQGMSHLRVNQYGGKIMDAIQIVPGTGIPKNIDYVLGLIKEMDYTLNIASLTEEKKGPRSGEISYVLYSTIKDKRKFSTVAQCFEEFLKEVAETKLKLFRHYLNASDLIHDSNRQDYIIIDDFKNTDEEDYLIEVKVRNNTPEELVGRQAMAREVMQYASQNLDPISLGHLLKETILGDSQALISHFTAPEETATQNLIALEKGMFPQFSETEDFSYKAKRITDRMNRADFHLLPPYIQQIFKEFLMLCEQKIAEHARDKMRLEKGIIPTTGPQINTDFYISAPSAGGGTKTIRAKFPSHSLEWLMEALKKQGTMMETIAPLPAPSQGRIGNMLNNNTGTLDALTMQQQQGVQQ